MQALLSTAKNSYWLVKVDLVELLSRVEWNAVPNRERSQREVLFMFLELLADEDVRVRTATSSSLMRLALKYFTHSSNDSQKVLTLHIF